MARDYLRRLELAARWRLPPEEAEEVAADYRELLGEQGEPESRWGKPGQAVRQLSAPKEYFRWLAVFILMTLAIAAPLWGFLSWHFYRYVYSLSAVLGAACALAWFSRQGAKSGKVPLRLWAMLLCQLALAGLAGGALWAAFYRWIDLVQAGMMDPGDLGPRLDFVFLLVCLASGALALLGLVLARVQDRRWRALYILGLTVLALCLLVMSALHSMSLEMLEGNWKRAYQIQGTLTALAGLIATGAGLC